MSIQILSPYPFFTAANGAPLNEGYIYIGEPNTNPETNPVACYFDSELTVPATQPLRTQNGYVVNGSTPASVYTADSYSIRVNAKNGTQVFYIAEVVNLATELLGPNGAALVGYDVDLTGSVSRSVANRLQDTVSFLDFLPGNLRVQYKDGTITADLTAYMVSAFAAASDIYFPEGTCTLETVDIPEGTTIRTAGHATRFKQLSTVSSIKPMLVIVGSNVTIEDCSVEGIISTGTSEFNHGIAVIATASTGDIGRTTIGNILGYNIRGDVVYVGADTGRLNTGISIGDVHGENVYRNVVSIIGGSNITVGRVSGKNVGLCIVDIEPEPANAMVSDVYIAQVVGGVFQCAPPVASAAAYNIRVGNLDLNPAYQANSSPGYPGYNVSNGVNLRNTSGLFINTAKIAGHTDFLLYQQYNSGELTDQSVTFGRLVASNIGSGESAINAYIQVSYIRVTILSGTCSSSVTTKRLISGSSAAENTPFEVRNMLLTNLGICRYTKYGVFSQIVFTGTADMPLFLDVDSSRFTQSTGTFGVLGSNATNFEIDQVVFTKAPAGTAVFTGTSSANRCRSSTLDSVYYGDRIFGAATATTWGTPTGTSDPSAFDVSTVTLPQLAARVNALIRAELANGNITSSST